MYFSKNSRYVLQKARVFSSKFFVPGKKLSFKSPKDDPVKPPLRVNVPKDIPDASEEQTKPLIDAKDASSTSLRKSKSSYSATAFDEDILSGGNVEFPTIIYNEEPGSSNLDQRNILDKKPLNTSNFNFDDNSIKTLGGKDPGAKVEETSSPTGNNEAKNKKTNENSGKSVTGKLMLPDPSVLGRKISAEDNDYPESSIQLEMEEMSEKFEHYMKSMNPYGDDSEISKAGAQTEKPSAAVNPSATVKPPEAANQPVSEKPSGATTQPEAATPPVAATPPAAATPPMAATPPATVTQPEAVTPPASVSPPAAATPSMAATPPMTATPPATVTQPETVTPPVAATPPEVKTIHADSESQSREIKTHQKEVSKLKSEKQGTDHIGSGKSFLRKKIEAQKLRKLKVIEIEDPITYILYGKGPNGKKELPRTYRVPDTEFSSGHNQYTNEGEEPMKAARSKTYPTEGVQRWEENNQANSADYRMNKGGRSSTGAEDEAQVLQEVIVATEGEHDAQKIAESNHQAEAYNYQNQELSGVQNEKTDESYPYLSIHELKPNKNTSSPGNSRKPKKKSMASTSKKIGGQSSESERLDTDAVNFQTAGSYVSFGCDKISTNFGAAFPPLLNEALKNRFKFKKGLFSSDKLGKNLTESQSGEKKVNEFSENSILFPKKENFDCESLFTTREDVILNLIKNSETKKSQEVEQAPKVPPENSPETTANNANPPPMDSLVVMKKVREIVQFDLDNAVKIFKDGQPINPSREVSSVIVLKEDGWKVDSEELALLIQQRKLKTELSESPIIKTDVDRDFFGDKMDQPAPDIKLPPQFSTDMKLSDSVMTYNPNTNQFHIHKEALAEAISRKTNEPYQEVKETLDFLSSCKANLEVKGGDSILVFDDETQTWKVDFSILEKREEQLKIEKELTKRSELILETFENLERSQTPNVQMPTSREPKTFDYQKEQWNTYNPENKSENKTKSKSPFKESDAEEIRKKNSDMYENLFIGNKKETGNKEPGGNPTDAPKKAASPKKAAPFPPIQKLSASSESKSSDTTSDSKKLPPSTPSTPSAPSTPSTPSDPPKKKPPEPVKEENYWDAFLRANILPRDISEIPKTKQTPPPPPPKPQKGDKPSPHKQPVKPPKSDILDPISKIRIRSSLSTPEPKKQPPKAPSPDRSSKSESIKPDPKKPESIKPEPKPVPKPKSDNFVLDTLKPEPKPSPSKPPPPPPPPKSEPLTLGTLKPEPKKPETAKPESKPSTSKPPPPPAKSDATKPEPKLPPTTPPLPPSEAPLDDEETSKNTPMIDNPKFKLRIPFIKDKKVKTPDTSTTPPPPPPPPPPTKGKNIEEADKKTTKQEKTAPEGQKKPPVQDPSDKSKGKPPATVGGTKPFTKSDAEDKPKPPADPKKTPKVASASEHYISDNIIEITRSKSSDGKSKVLGNKIETVKVNINSGVRQPSKVTEINLNKHSEKKSAPGQQEPKVMKEQSDNNPSTKTQSEPENKNFYKKFEKYKTPFSEPDFEENAKKIRSDIESNPNMKKLDNWNKTLVLQDIVKPPDNIENWLKDETDKMATLLLKVLHEAGDGKPKRKPPVKSKLDKPGKANPYDNIRKKQENSPENFLFRVRTVNWSLENDAKAKQGEKAKVDGKAEDTKTAAMRSEKKVKMVESTSLPTLKNEPASETTAKSSETVGPQEETKPKPVNEAEVTLMSKEYSQVMGMEFTEDVPGPEILKKISNTWKMFPILGSQLTVFTLLRVFQLVNIGTTFLHNQNLDRIRRTEFSKLFTKYGPIVNVQGPLSGNVILIHTPEHLSAALEQDVCMTTRSVFDSLEHIRQEAEDMTTPGSIFSDWSKPQWNELRKATNDPLVSGSDKYFECVSSAGDALLSIIRKNRNSQQTVNEDFMEDIRKWSLEGLCNVLFEKSFGFLEGKTKNLGWVMEPSKMYLALEEANACLNKCERGFQLWRLMSTPSGVGLGRAYRALSTILSKQFYQSEMNLRSKYELIISGGPSFPAKDLTFIESMMLNDGMTIDEITCNLVDIILIGTNMMSTTIGFLLYHLSHNVKAQLSLFKEVKEILLEKDSQLSYYNLSSMKYLHACIKECLRLHFPIPVFYRLLQNDVLLANYIIPKSTFVVMDFRVSGMKEQIFEEPDKFIPERWLSEEKWLENIHPFTAFPFCHGPRAELAKRVTEMQLMACIAKIVRNFQIEYHYGEIKGTDGIVSYPDKPLKFSFTEREA